MNKLFDSLISNDKRNQLIKYAANILILLLKPDHPNEHGWTYGTIKAFFAKVNIIQRITSIFIQFLVLKYVPSHNIMAFILYAHYTIKYNFYTY